MPPATRPTRAHRSASRGQNAQGTGSKYWTQILKIDSPVVVWLATPAADGVTGQIFHAAGGLVGIMQQPKVIRSFQSGERWTLDGLNQVMPTLVKAKQAHDERADKEGEPESF